jgi:N-hydroxyarylamine O-acetyltransferase
LPLAPEPDVEGLNAVQRAHRLAIPFENLDIALGRGVSLAPDDLFDKLVTRRRGGYCFEQNGILLAALQELKFDARPLLARVWLGASDVPPLTHSFSLVRIGGEPWIADAGFGGGYTPPMPLVDDVEADTPDGARHRLVRHDDYGWMLERLAGDGQDGWQRQYSFTLDQIWPADLAMANHYTATLPGGRFTGPPIASIVLPNGFASLMGRSYNRSSRKGQERSEIKSARAYRMRLSLVFGLDLTAEEVAELGLFA